MRRVSKPVWFADRWLYSAFNESCEHSLEQVAANALCSVLNQEVIFNMARFANISAPFNSSIPPIATLNLSEATGGGVVCAQESAGRFIIDFRMPPGANAIRHPSSRTSVSESDQQQFQELGFGFQNENYVTGSAQMWINLRRVRPTAPNNEVGVTITGTYQNLTGEWSGRGRLRLVCP